MQPPEIVIFVIGRLIVFITPACHSHHWFVSISGHPGIFGIQSDFINLPGKINVICCSRYRHLRFVEGPTRAFLFPVAEDVAAGDQGRYVGRVTSYSTVFTGLRIAGSTIAIRFLKGGVEEVSFEY